MTDRPNWQHKPPAPFGRPTPKPLQEALILEDPAPDGMGTMALPGLGAGGSLYGGLDHGHSDKVSHS